MLLCIAVKASKIDVTGFEKGSLGRLEIRFQAAKCKYKLQGQIQSITEVENLYLPWDWFALFSVF